MDIYLVRHGLTVENIKNIRSGANVQGTLSPKGIAQAKLAARKLKDNKVDVIYASDLKRARHTAKHISKFHKGVPVVYTPSLREFAYGRFDGTLNTEARKGELMRLIYTNVNGNRAGIETLNQAHSRVEKFITILKKKHKNHNVILVSHGGIGKVIEAVLCDLPKSQIRHMRAMDNAEIKHFKVN